MMPEQTTTVRTRLSVATFTVPCLAGETHTVRITTDGQITNPHHDLEADEIILALGGEPHPCGRAVVAFEIARDIYRARAGERDVPNVRGKHGTGWRPRGEGCPDCTRYSRPMDHFLTPSHQAHVRNVSDLAHPISILVRWLVRNSNAGLAYTNGDVIATDFPALLDSLRSNRFTSYQKGLVLTPAFVEAATTVLGAHLGDIYALRSLGVRVEWLRTLTAGLNRSAKAHLVARATASRTRYSTTSKVSTLLNSVRNVDPATVAKFLNAGIYAHIHTYARAHVRPAQVLAVFNATGGDTTLADLMNEGLTVQQALRRVGVGN
jgi:hypothetical protein